MFIASSTLKPTSVLEISHQCVQTFWVFCRFVLRDSVSSRCHPRPRLAAGSVAAGSVAQAVRLHAQFYKKTKQLPVLGRCCDEIQPHQWRPPVEREEHRLPFWLKVGPLRGGHARASGPLPTSGAEPAARGPPVLAHPTSHTPQPLSRGGRSASCGKLRVWGVQSGAVLQNHPWKGDLRKATHM